MILTEKTKQNYTGVGIYKQHNRNYIGDYIDGKEHGMGMYEAKLIDKTPLHRYVGQFKDNKAEGIGIKLYGHGGKYCGEYKNNERNGLGYWKYSTGATFVGEFKDHLPNGFGIFITWEGFKFIGYVNGWETGKGKWYDQNNNEIDIRESGYNKKGMKYVGEFRDGKRTGQGTMTYSDGGKYEGKWNDGKQHGQGTFSFTDGRKWAGEFRGNKPWNLSLFDKKGNINMKWVNGKKQ